MDGLLAAVVVRWRGGEEVDRCLRCLLDHGGSLLDEVVLVDSGSADGGADRLADAFPEVEVLALAENRSFAWAANHGASATRAPFILILNPDTEVRPSSLGSLADFLDRHPQLAGCVPMLEQSDSRPQHRWQLRRLPQWVDLARGRPGAAQFRHPPTVPMPVEQPAAAAWLVRRSVWQALDGLDPGFSPAWWEDVDFCARLDAALGEAGFPAAQGFWVVPEARILHHGGSSLARLSEAQFLTAFNRNLLRYARRHLPGRARLIAAGVRVGLLARIAIRPHRRRAYLQALRSL